MDLSFYSSICIIFDYRFFLLWFSIHKIIGFATYTSFTVNIDFPYSILFSLYNIMDFLDSIFIVQYYGFLCFLFSFTRIIDLTSHSFIIIQYKIFLVLIFVHTKNRFVSIVAPYLYYKTAIDSLAI